MQLCALTFARHANELIFPSMRQTMASCSFHLPLLAASLLLNPVVLAFSSSSNPTTIQVYDGVLSEAAASTLHESAMAVGLGHRAFARPLTANGVYNPIELALDEILSEMDGDNTDDDISYVEYWSRQEWRSIEAHADVDEFRAKEEDSSSEAPAIAALGPDGYRYPKFGHVLYLQVGREVRGPTCVWPDRRSGGELLKKANDGGDETCIEASSQDDKLELVIVPAKGGRLLRFPGSALHAVPRPHNLWFLPFVMGSAIYEPEEEWGRSVLLFNVWQNEAPAGVSLNTGEGHRGDDIDSCKSGSDTDVVKCNTKSNWKENEIRNVGQDTDETKAAKIWLLGNERRRDFPMRTIKLSAPETTQDALAEETVVSRVWMRQ